MAILMDELERLLCLMGHMPNGDKDKCFYIYSIYLLIWMVDLLFGLIYEWKNFIMRLSVINDLFLLISLLLYWHFLSDTYILFGIIKRYKKKLKECRSFKSINRKLFSQVEKIDDYLDVSLKLYIIFHFIHMCVPISTVLYTVLTSEDVIDFRRMPQIWYFHYPVTHVTLKHYLYGSILIYFGMLGAACLSFCIVYSVFFSLYCVVSSFNHFRLCMVEWDNLASIIMAKSHSLNSQEQKQLECEFELRNGLNEIVVFHQNLCSETYNVNKGMQRLLLVFINGCAVQMCLGFFTVTEGDNKLKYVTYASMVLVFLIGLSAVGELVKSKVDILRTTLWECSWVDKPNFYRKTLLLMMTRASKELEINPYGLQTLDMNAFTKILKLIYSISNVVSHFRSRES